MKTVTKFLTFALILAAFGAISVISTKAQTLEQCTPMYDKFKENRKGPAIEQYQTAIASGKEYIEKCSALEGQEEVLKYIQGQVPKLEKIVADLIVDRDVYQPFNTSVPAKDWDKAFSLGKKIIEINSDSLDVMLVLASIGFDNSVATPPNDKFNNEAISYAKMAIQKMDENKPSPTGNYGAFIYVYKTKDCQDGKTNAIGWMNYTIGNIMYSRLNQKKDALPYLYKSTQVGCQTKDGIALIYRNIGNYYVDEFVRLEADKNAAYDVLSKLKTDDPTFPDAEKKYKDLVALQKGYMERIMDAFARGYKAAVKAKETPAFITALLNRSKEFYGFRNGKTPTVTFETWLAGLPATFPDPTVAVTPIVEAETTAAPTAMTAGADTSGNSTGTDTRPRTAPTTTTTKAATTTTTKAPATTKKPAPIKKP